MGAVGCVVGGWLGDVWGRTKTCALMMVCRVWWPLWGILSMCARCAGVRVSYTVDERPIALTHTHTHSLTHAPTHSLSVQRRQIMSGTCSILIGLVWELPLWVTVLVSLVWGFSIVADSAQFSAIVIEVAEQAYVGTAVTAQVPLMKTGLGGGWQQVACR